MNKLNRQSIRHIASLTPMQQGMLFHYLERPQGTQYVQQLCLNLEGPLDCDVARESWNVVAVANPTLRTLFRWDAINEPVQVVQKDPDVEFRVVDCLDTQALETVKDRDLQEAFDLRHVPFRVTVCRLAGGENALLVSYHHILMDGWSMAVMLRQFLTAYREIVDGAPIQLPVNDAFHHFVAWRKQKDSRDEENYWREYLDGCDARRPFPFLDAPPRHCQDSAAERFHYELPVAEARAIGQLTQKYKVTPAAVFYTAWGVLLQKYTGSDDALFGTTVSGRSVPIAGIDEAMGLFINTLPLRIVANANDRGQDLLQQTANTLRQRETREHTALTEIRRYAGVEPSHELLDSLVVMENYPLQKQLAGNGPLKVNSYSMAEQTNYNLALAIEKSEDTYWLTWIFKPGPMPRWLMKQVAGHFSRVLNLLAEETGRPVWHWELPDDEEKRLLMEEWNDTARDYPGEKTIHQLVLERAERQPDAVALVWAGDGEGAGQCVCQTTYREFVARATVLARYLKGQGAGDGQPVAVRLERSLSLVITLQAVLMTGSAYVPVDPSYPEGRISYMLEDSGCKIEISDPGQLEAAMRAEISVEKSLLAEEDSSLPAYVIYTSGSTGLPKGVLVRHRSIVNTLWWRMFAYGFSAKDAVLQIPSFAFDSSVEDIWTPLISGSSLVMLAESQRLNPRYLETAIQRGRVSHFLITPHFYRTLLAEFDPPPDSLTSVTVAGEGFDIDLVKRHFELLPHVRLLNEYGPTENSVCSTIYEFSPSDRRVVVGTPIDNVECYILDLHGNWCPTGVAGELCLAGSGLAAGYLNRPEATFEAFGPRHDRYRTGDRALRQPDGNIRFLGRLDHQVKIRGFRVELQEIEAQLTRHQAVTEAVVVVRKNSAGDNVLCAYVILGAETGMSELENFLARQLPAYMVPSFIMPLASLPLTPHGKVDLNALPEPAETALQRYVPPRDRLDQDLVGIWAAVLDKDAGDIGIDHNFFELGGHSLKAMTLSSRIHKELGVPVPISDIFDHPTIRLLRDCISGPEEEEASTGIPVFEKREYYDLSFAQRRLWILCQFEEDSTAYNMPGVFSLRGNLDIPALSAAVQTLADRHDSLRTRFFSLNGAPKQQVLESLTVRPAIEDLRQLPLDQRQQRARELFVRDADSPFRLEDGGLFRVSLILMAEDHTILVFNTHHIISDGWSTGIIRKEIFALYNAYTNGESNPLPPLSLQYKDYTLWHNNLIAGGGFGESEGYWLGKFVDRPNGIELPLDFSRRPIQTFNGGRVSLVVDRRRTQGLELLGRKQDATLFMCLLAYTAAILQRYSGQRDIIIGSPVAGRQNPELHHMTGFLVNTLVYRIDTDPEMNFSQLLQAVKQENLLCYQYQDYPFDLLMEKLELDRDLSQSPLFNFMMAHNNTWTHESSSDMSGVQLSGVEFADEFNMSKFDLVFIMDLIDDTLDVKIEYNSDLFRGDTILRLRDNMNTLLDSILESPNEPLRQLRFLHHLEEEMVTRGFNHNRRPFPSLTVQEMVERQVEAKPDAIAVTHHQLALSYGELNRRANRLAHTLRERFGAGPNRVIGVTMERSLEMIVTLLGIVKSGAGYVAVDPTYPPDRVQHMLKDSDAKLTVIDCPRPQLFAAYEGELVTVQELSGGHGDGLDSNPEILNQPDDILYVIYTSGSTGVPNGAMLSQRILSNLLQWERHETSIDLSLRCLQFTSINFCVSFQEIFGTLSGGGEVHLIGDVERQDIDFLMTFLAAHRIGLLYLPFSYLNFLFNESGRWGDFFNHSLRHIITAGEQLKITAGLKQFLELNPALQLHNHYGSSEMHVVTSFTLDASDTDRYPVPPAGKPVANTSIYILDPQGNPVAVGAWGELCIAGAGEVLGYINNPTLTAHKVQPHRLSPGTRLYHSGDIGRWLPDGNIEIKGRKDFQVKVRGFRVEPAEIESKIFALPEVKDCVVVVREDEKRQKYLAAYIVVDGAAPLDIRRQLAGSLPNYMIPKLVVLEALPLMANGKVDRDKLPDPRDAESQSPNLEPAHVERLSRTPVSWSEAANRSLAERVAAYIALARQTFPYLDLPLESIILETDPAPETGSDFPFQKDAEPDKGVVAAADGRSINVSQLVDRSSQLALRLPAGASSRYGLLMKPSLLSLETMLAVVKNGGSIVELDPGLDRKALRENLKREPIDCLLTASDLIERFPFTTLQALGHGDAPLAKTPPRPAISHLDELPILNRSTVNYEKYSQSIGITMVKHCVTILSSRGCPYHCAYCHKIWPKKQVCRSAEHIFAEVEAYYTMGVRRFAFIDDIFNLNEKNSSRFFRMVLDRGMDAQFYFSGGLRGDILSRPFIDLMVEAGTVDIAVALETASPRLQRLIGKNLDVEKLRDSLQYIAETYPHVILELHSMHGFPTETQEEARMTLDFIDSIRWLDFPYIHVMKIYPNTPMHEFALKNGVSPEAILDSEDLAFHQWSPTMPFERSFTQAYQADFLNNYFLDKERLRRKLPLQANILTEGDMVQKYDSYLPATIRSLDDILDFAGMKPEDFGPEGERALEDCRRNDSFAVPDLNQKLAAHFGATQPATDALRILLLDLSQFFRADGMLFDVVEVPLGLLSLQSYLHRELGDRVRIQVAKARVDFDSYEELKRLIEDFQPQLLGIRTLTFYKHFFHKTVNYIRHWGVDVPIVAGGPYASSDYATILNDRHIDLAVIGEGELTFKELVEAILAAGGGLPGDDELARIAGIAYVPRERKDELNSNIVTLADLLTDSCASQEAVGDMAANDALLPVSLPLVGSHRDLLGPLAAKHNILFPPELQEVEIFRLDLVPVNGGAENDSRLEVRLWLNHSLTPVAGEQGSDAPQDGIETRLAAIWADLLGIDASTIGREDNFFDIGGHSLKATLMVSRLHEQLAVQVPLVDVFQSPTLRELADVVRNAGSISHSGICPQERRDYYPLSSGQVRIFIQQGMRENNCSYNMPTAMMLEGNLDIGILQNAIMSLIQRHEALRTYFFIDGGEPVQRIAAAADFRMEHLPSVGGGDGDVERLILGFIRPFDLSSPPLVRVGLAPWGDGRHLLVFDIHHIVSDGVSMAVLVKDFMALYRGEELEPLAVQYKDFACWQRQREDFDEDSEAMSYWLRIFAQEAPPLRLPLDFSRPDLQSYSGERLVQRLDPNLVAGIRRLASNSGATLYMVLLAAYNVLLYRYTGQEDLTVGTAVAGREHRDIEEVMGMFVNMIPMRNTIVPSQTFAGFLSGLRGRVLEAFSHQDCQFEELVRRLNLRGQYDRNPLFSTVLQVQNVEIPRLQIPGLSLTPIPFERGIANFDLVLLAMEEGNDIDLALVYSTEVFKRETAQRFLDRFQEILQTVVETPERPVTEIDISSEVTQLKTDILAGDDEDFDF